MSNKDSGLSILLRAFKFASIKHTDGKRKDHRTPYINHPIDVVNILVAEGDVQDYEILAAAALHDTVEDTETTEEELRTAFGDRVLSLVLECTDDKKLPKAARKEAQVHHAPHLTPDAKMIKIADKVSNMRDVVHTPAPDWSWDRRSEYLEWSMRVFAGLKGANAKLDELFEREYKAGRAALEACRARV